MMSINFSKTPDLTFLKIVHTGVEYRGNFEDILEYFKIKLS
jgi:hypothetical protein